ncbi:MAG: hypothetical protein ACOYEW_12120 [Anaerolineae bacterium]|jgi:hypothetical protein
MVSAHGSPIPVALYSDSLPAQSGVLSRNDLRLDWRGSSGPDYMSFRYVSFHGCEWRVVRVKRRGFLWLRYQADLRRGRLSLELANSEGTPIWQCCLRGSGSERLKVPIPEPGVYQLRVRGENTSGAYDLRWRARATRRSPQRA